MTTAKKRVLLIEDEPLVEMVIEGMLDEIGYEVIRGPKDVQSAIAIARKEGFDMAVLDLVIEDGSVFPVAAILHERQVPFIFVTGLDTSKIGDKLRGVPILKKPFGATALEAALKAIEH